MNSITATESHQLPDNAEISSALRKSKVGENTDASMDDIRGEYTAEALRRLKQHVDQVILIIHKRPEADHMIKLTK